MKEMDITKLVRVSTYAKMNNVTTECVRQWCKSKKVDSITIDGVRFVVSQ